MPAVPPEFKDKVVPKAIGAPKRAASSSSGRSVSASKGRWSGARKRREVTTEDIKELSDKIEKYVSGSSPVVQSVETHGMEVDESSSVPEVTKALSDVVLNANDTSGDAEMKDSDPSAADLGEAIVEQTIDAFGTAIAGDI